MDKLNDFKNIFLEEFSKIQKFEGPSYLYDPIKYFIKSPGKRLRPVIVLFLGDLFKNDKKDSINGALGVELLHNFTLVHDDIMDEDDLRHNVVTIHKKWDNAHAVLSGDGLGALGPIFIGKIKKNTLKILIRYNEVILEICEGQAYDMEFEKKDFVSVNDYLLMSAKKTGSLFELCFEIASLISDKYEKYLKNLKYLITSSMEFSGLIVMTSVFISPPADSSGKSKTFSTLPLSLEFIRLNTSFVIFSGKL